MTDLEFTPEELERLKAMSVQEVMDHVRRQSLALSALTETARMGGSDSLVPPIADLAEAFLRNSLGALILLSRRSVGFDEEPACCALVTATYEALRVVSAVRARTVTDEEQSYGTMMRLLDRHQEILGTLLDPTSRFVMSAAVVPDGALINKPAGGVQ
jgi:hypothetical protein